MIRTATRAVTWLVDGTTETVAGLLGRLRRRASLRVVIAAEGTVVTARNGAILARLVTVAGTLRLEPPEAAAQLAGSAIEVAVPTAWLFRRQLDPVAAEGAPFLHAFVHHQIERITPWRPDDVHFCVHHAAMPGDPKRLAIEIGVIPKRLVQGVLDRLSAARPARLALVARAPGEGPAFVMAVGNRDAERLAVLRPFVALALAVFLLAWPAALAWVAWTTGMVADDIAAADRVIDDRKAVLDAARRHDSAADRGDAALQHLRDARPRMVDLLESLSAALPATAYATDIAIDKDRIRVSGVSTNTPDLVPALESSGHFGDATFFEATTRMEDGRGDRFHIDMRALPAASP